METTDLRTEFTKETKTRFNTEWLAYNDYVDWLEQRLVKLLTIPPVINCPNCGSNNNNETANGTKPVLVEGFMYVWFDTNTGKFSRPFSKEDVEKYLDEKDIQQAKQDKWALIEYKSLNGVEFDF